MLLSYLLPSKTRKQNRATMKKLLYHYERIYESWVFMTEKDVQKHTDLFNAFSAETWGEFRKTIPKEDYEWISQNLIEDQFTEEFWNDEGTPFQPPDDAPFIHNDWLDDAEYPPYLIFLQHDHVPDAILKKYGEKQLTVHDGEYYQFKKEVIEHLLKELKEHGFECERRDDLVIDMW